jgi:FkbM family methyltransferase
MQNSGLRELITNPLRVNRFDLLKLNFRKEYVNTCNVRGVKIKIGVRSSLELFRCETYDTKEPETLDWIDQFRENEILFDIGGNIGVYSMYAGKKGARVYAFEPESQNFSRLVNNTSLNALVQVTPYCLGLGQKSEFSFLNITSLNAGDSQHQVAGEDKLYDRSFEKIKQGCVVFSLNDLCFVHGLPIPDHIKIDVDGLEPEIILGADKVLQHPGVKTVLIEINKSADDKYDIQQFIESQGFSLHGVSKREFRTEKVVARNYIFKKKTL